MDDVPVYYAWLAYCAQLRDPGCIVREIGAEDIAWVNAAINRGMTPVNDAGPDTWTPFPADRRGDCDDYVVSKRLALFALGFPADAMTIVAGALDNGDRHLVLEVTLSGATWVLDNLVTDEIYRSGKQPYGWREIARQPVTGAIWRQPK